MDNASVARLLQDVASLLELKEANPFRIMAYRNAASTLEDLPTPLHEMIERGEDLTQLEFVGKDLAAAITTLVTTGKLKVLDELSAEVPLTLLEILRIPGIGPKTVKRLWQALGVTTVEELETAAREGHIAALDGFGKKTQENILRRIERSRLG